MARIDLNKIDGFVDISKYADDLRAKGFDVKEIRPGVYDVTGLDHDGNTYDWSLTDRPETAVLDEVNRMPEYKGLPRGQCGKLPDDATFGDIAHKLILTFRVQEYFMEKLVVNELLEM